MKTFLCFFFSITCLFSANSYKLSEKTIIVNGEPRTYLSEAPTGIPPVGGWPVLFLFHGAMQKGCIWFNYDGFKAFTEKALKKGYYIIAPDALYRKKGSVDNLLGNIGAPRWNTKKIPHQPIPPSTDFGNNDINFISALLSSIKDQPFLNSDEIFFTGFSSGAAFTMLAALAFTTRIKTAAINSGGFIGDLDFKLPPSGHPPMLINHGTYDFVVNYESSLSYFEALHKAGIHTKLNLAQKSGHHWLSRYDEEVFDWFETHKQVHKNLKAPEKSKFIICRFLGWPTRLYAPTDIY